jgi:hypothetical protein
MRMTNWLVFAGLLMAVAFLASLTLSTNLLWESLDRERVDSWLAGVIGVALSFGWLMWVISNDDQATMRISAIFFGVIVFSILIGPGLLLFFKLI